MYPGVPDAHAGLRQAVAAGGQRARDAEIGDHRVPAAQENVVRLDVAVDHAVAMRVVERVGHLARDGQRVGDGQLALAIEPRRAATRPRRTAS